MSILIKGLKLPKDCAVKVAIRDGIASVYLDEGKADYYSIIELPDHGRLIDADVLDTSVLQEGFSYAFTRRKLRYTAGDVRQKIAYAPTVIPAERSEDG